MCPIPCFRFRKPMFENKIGTNNRVECCNKAVCISYCCFPVFKKSHHRHHHHRVNKVAIPVLHRSSPKTHL